MPTWEIRVRLTPVTTVHGTLLSRLSLVFDSHPQSLPRITQIPSSVVPNRLTLTRPLSSPATALFLDVPSE